MRRVEGWGSKRAKLVIIAEAPGEREENVGQPLVGPSGFRLNEWMARVGLSRTDAYIDNVYQHRPPGNQIKVIDRITLEQWMGYLHERIAELEDPYVIVPTGNYALYALTGKGKVHWHMRDGREQRPGILDWRGSILEYVDLRGRTIKCIPTIHPAATFRQPSLERACVVDWERIASELTFRELRRPIRTHHIYPSISQLAALHQSACEPSAVLAIDIENPRSSKTAQVYEEDGTTPAVFKSGKRKGHKKTKKVAGEPKIVCIGFALTPTESITVPTDLSYWKSEDRWKEAWTWIRHLCTSPAEKVLHNGLYDTFFLADHGIRLANWKWDTLYMHHCLTGDTKVLMGDLTWGRLDNIEVGSELASFDESAPGGHRRLRLSRVTAVSSREARTHEVDFSNGETICGTRDHRFLVGTRERHGRANGGIWKELHELRTGDEVWSIGRPWTVPNNYDTGWLAGFYDGEGCVDHRLKPQVTQNPGATLEHARALLTKYGFSFSDYKCRDTRVLVLTGGLCQFLRFLGQIRPQRLLAKVRTFLKKGAGDSQYIRGNATVVDVRLSGLSRKVFDISTTTRTFIANGILVHNCLDASAPHDLAYCASVDTREPYWKSEAKDPDESSKYTSNWAAFLTYNGKDCCATRELCDIYTSRLAGLTLQGEPGLKFYLRHYPPLLEPLLDLMRHGIRVDAHKRKYRLLELMANCVDLQDRLTMLSGMQLYGTTSLSTAKLKKYLYEQLALPKQWRKRKDTGEKTETVDEVAVRRLMERHPACLPLQSSGPLILSHRRQQTLLHFYKTERVDDDGRYRSSYSPNTEAGRLSSSRNPRGTGSNAQNVDREARDIFLADRGMVGVEVDGSQVEARIDYLLIYMLTQDRSVLDKARLRPDEYDQHTENAAAIFNKPATSITKEERYLGKKAVHAAFRDMQGQKLADELLKEGRIYSADQCEKLIKAFRHRLGVGYIEDLFRWIRGRIIKDRYLENSWGRRLWFEYDRLDDEAYRRGYSFDPQSECADWMNQRGLIPLHHYLKGVGGNINAHVHDSLFFSVPRETAYDATKFLVESLEQPRTYWGVELSIPCEIKVGGRWKCEQEWKRMPSREEFEATVATLTLVP